MYVRKINFQFFLQDERLTNQTFLIKTLEA